MKPQTKFDQLVDATKTTTGYKINDKGTALLAEYREHINQLADSLVEPLSFFSGKPDRSAKQGAIHLISMINANGECRPEIDAAIRLDSMTHGGTTNIDPNLFVFNNSDPLLFYLDKNPKK